MMSKISQAKGRKDGNSGYARVVGNAQLGQLLSKVQATVISNGTELERLITERCTLVPDIDQFIDDVTIGKINNGIYLCLKRVFKQSQKYANGVAKIEPDMIIFIVESHRVCKIIELKDGDMFDTKKSEAEKNNLEKFATIFGAKIPFVTDYYICSFNQQDKNAIMVGFKGVFSLDHILTGQELCEILKISYQEILDLRKNDAEENFKYLISEMMKIPEVRKEIEIQLKGN